MNLVNYIDNRYEKKLITDFAYKNLRAVYDIDNRRLLGKKIYELAKDCKLTKIIEILLKDQMFYVTLQDENSKLKRQNYDSSQGSVLIPFLFNIYTNYQPIEQTIINSFYSNDLLVASQGNKFTEIEEIWIDT